MLHPIRKSISDKFQQHLSREYRAYCEIHQLDNNSEHFLTFLIDRGLIPPKEMNRFAVWQEFTNQLPLHHSKTATVRVLSDYFNLSERHIWNILKYHHAEKIKGRSYQHPESES